MLSKLYKAHRRKRRVGYQLKLSQKGNLMIHVFKSNKHLSVQVICPTKGTLISASTLEKEMAAQYAGANQHGATLIAELLAKRINSETFKEEGRRLIYNRGSYKYTGVIKTLADSLRKNGVAI